MKKIIIGVISAVVVTGAIVGGIVGFKATKSSGNETSNINSQNNKIKSIIDLDIKTDIWKYIDNNEWDLARMSTDLGWVQSDKINETARIYAGTFIFTQTIDDTAHIKFAKPSSSWAYYTDADHLTHIEIASKEHLCMLYFNGYNLDESIKIKGSFGSMVPIEAIIASAYVMENSNGYITQDLILNMFENQRVAEIKKYERYSRTDVVLNY